MKMKMHFSCFGELHLYRYVVAVALDNILFYCPFSMNTSTHYHKNVTVKNKKYANTLEEVSG